MQYDPDFAEHSADWSKQSLNHTIGLLEYSPTVKKYLNFQSVSVIVNFLHWHCVALNYFDHLNQFQYFARLEQIDLFELLADLLDDCFVDCFDHQFDAASDQTVEQNFAFLVL